LLEVRTSKANQICHNPLDFRKFQQKKVIFLVSNGKKRISPLLASPKKILGKSPSAPPSWKKSFRRPWLPL